jgi:hypothetical protein
VPISKKSIQVLRDIFDKPSFTTSLLVKVTETSQLLSLYRNPLDELAAGRITTSRNMMEEKQAVANGHGRWVQPI